MSKVAPSTRMREQVRALVSGLGGDIESDSQMLSELVRRTSALASRRKMPWRSPGFRRGSRS